MWQDYDGTDSYTKITPSILVSLKPTIFGACSKPEKMEMITGLISKVEPKRSEILETIGGLSELQKKHLSEVLSLKISCHRELLISPSRRL